MSGHMLDTEFVAAADKNSRRLMVVLHGLGDSVAGYYWMPPMLNLPWLNYLLVNAPDDYYGGFSWFDFMGNPEPGIARSRGLLGELLDQQRQKGWPTEETTLFGFSQGCVVALAAACHCAHRFAGVVGISGVGLLPNPDQLIRQANPLSRQQRFLITHGTQDPMIPFASAQRQVAQLKAGGLPIEWHEFAKEHTIAGEAELAIIRQFVTAGYPP
jgi:phospholipase/carboxylesterase